MAPLTDDRPKCLLTVGGRTLLEHAIENLRLVGCSQIVIVVGYKAEMIDVPTTVCVTNHDYADNNVLHSLMTARDYLVGPVMVIYSDILVEPWVYQHLMVPYGQIILAVDRNWRPYYEGRTEHPLSEADKVYIDQTGAVRRIGKHLDSDAPDDLVCGEFIGLWRMDEEGTARFREEFLAVDAVRTLDASFQQSKNWRNAYVTDLIQELVDRGQKVSCAIIEQGWAELDTPQDYHRLSSIAESQRLETIVTDFNHTMNGNPDSFCLKILGTRILSEANDLKRNSEALAEASILDLGLIEAIHSRRV